MWGGISHQTADESPEGGTMIGLEDMGALVGGDIVRDRSGRERKTPDVTHRRGRTRSGGSAGPPAGSGVHHGNRREGSPQGPAMTLRYLPEPLEGLSLEDPDHRAGEGLIVPCRLDHQGAVGTVDHPGAAGPRLQPARPVEYRQLKPGRQGRDLRRGPQLGAYPVGATAGEA